uniref:Uncharacterized protein n=1 Tax=Populus trichocarpa TaxID=3694 RepID=A9PGN1_POPTR|nr:unknown [Populus trichocarpa]
MVLLMLHWIMPMDGWYLRKQGTYIPQMNLKLHLTLGLPSALTCIMRQYVPLGFHRIPTRRKKVLRKGERGNNKSKSLRST